MNIIFKIILENKKIKTNEKIIYLILLIINNKNQNYPLKKNNKNTQNKIKKLFL
jgi:hypothetical protein